MLAWKTYPTSRFIGEAGAGGGGSHWNSTAGPLCFVRRARNGYAACPNSRLFLLLTVRRLLWLVFVLFALCLQEEEQEEEAVEEDKEQYEELEQA